MNNISNIFFVIFCLICLIAGVNKQLNGDLPNAIYFTLLAIFYLLLLIHFNQNKNKQ